MGEGLAVGCLALGIAAVTSGKTAVESAFRRAWRQWAWSSQFPAIHASLTRNDLLPILRNSSRRRRRVIAEWSSTGPEYQPRLREPWDNIEEAAEDLPTFTSVPLQGWVELARVFIEDLGENKVRRAE